MGRAIPRTYLCAFVALMLIAVALPPANASPNCLSDYKPFSLTGDSTRYSMAIEPGANCIQGLRWSFMQIYAVWVLAKPAHGKLVIVGPGFRYFAKPDFRGSDTFKLVVVGKNRRKEGYSTVDITVSPRNAPRKVSALAQSGS